MKRIFYYIICLVLISACKQELCKYIHLSDDSAIQMSIDWLESNINQTSINNTSIYAYPEDGGSPYLRVSGDIESAYINLPAGGYSLLLFNDVVGDIAGINFRDIDSYNGSYATVIEQSTTSDIYYQIEDGEMLVMDHEQLAAWQMENLDVTLEMVSCPYCGEAHSEEVLLNVVPMPITTECYFTIQVENLNNAQSIQCVVKGFAAGAYLASGERISNTNSTILYSFNFTSRTYDTPNYIDGFIEAQITTFGKDPNEDQIYELVLDVILNNGERVTFTRDITEQVIVQDGSKILINLESSINKIVLPEGNGTGFGVESWGDRESIELL